MVPPSDGGIGDVVAVKGRGGGGHSFSLMPYFPLSIRIVSGKVSGACGINSGSDHTNIFGALERETGGGCAIQAAGVRQLVRPGTSVRAF